jgi:poly(glycerol-phosphate) alpha-glucosyltransferase
MMDRWIVSRGRLKKSIAEIAYERRSWRQATLFHALTGQEAEDILAVAGRTDTVIIPNAVPEAVARTGERRPSVVYLGRIHPKKNIHSLIDAWQSAADVLRPLGAKLQIAGWGDADDVAQLKARIDAAADDSVEFLGPVYGERKAQLLGGARYLALPSHSEGLPMVILEAWAAGTPTLMSQHCHLPEGYTAGAALDCGTDVAAIAETLRRGMRLDPSAWAAMSQAATTLARHNFSRSSIAARWSETYQRLIADHAAKAKA